MEGHVEGATGLPDPDEVARRWTDAYPPGVPARWPVPDASLSRALQEAAADFPAATAVVGHRTRRTWLEVADRADRLAAALAGLGVGAGDVVAAVLPACPQLPTVAFAVWRLGAVLSVHAPDAPDAELAADLRAAGATTVVCLDAGYPALAGMKGRLPSVERVVVTSRREEAAGPGPALDTALRRGRWRSRLAADEPVVRLGWLIDACPPTPPAAEVDPDRPALVTWEAGGEGGGRWMSHRALLAAALSLRLWVEDFVAGDERVLALLPPSHPAGVVLGAVLPALGAAAAVPLERFDPQHAAARVARERPTLAVLTPAVLDGLCRAARGEPGADLSSLRVVIVVGGELPDRLVRDAEGLTGGQVRAGLWLQAAGGLSHAEPCYRRHRPGSVGLPLPEVVAGLRDEADPAVAAEPASAQRPGRLVLAGPQLPAGRWAAGESEPEPAAGPPDVAGQAGGGTVRADALGGWLLSDVRGWLDDDGWLHPVGADPRADGGGLAVPTAPVGAHDGHARLEPWLAWPA